MRDFRSFRLGLMLLTGLASTACRSELSELGGAETEASYSTPASLPCKPLRNVNARTAIFAAASTVVRASYGVSKSKAEWEKGWELSERLMNFYMDNAPPCGRPFRLSEQETQQVLHESERDGRPIDVRQATMAVVSGGRWQKAQPGESFAAWMLKLPDGSHRVSSRFVAFGKSHWTNLHGIDAQFQTGGLVVKRGGSWSYFARMTINDYWDPDSKPWGSGSRDPGVEAVTRAWQQVPGNPFDVSSAVVCVSQSNLTDSISISDCANLQ